MSFAAVLIHFAYQCHTLTGVESPLFFFFNPTKFWPKGLHSTFCLPLRRWISLSVNVVFMAYEGISVPEEWFIKGDLWVAWEDLMDAARFWGECFASLQLKKKKN